MKSRWRELWDECEQRREVLNLDSPYERILYDRYDLVSKLLCFVCLTDDGEEFDCKSTFDLWGVEIGITYDQKRETLIQEFLSALDANALAESTCRQFFGTEFFLEHSGEILRLVDSVRQYATALKSLSIKNFDTRYILGPDELVQAQRARRAAAERTAEKLKEKAQPRLQRLRELLDEGANPTKAAKLISEEFDVSSRTAWNDIEEVRTQIARERLVQLSREVGYERAIDQVTREFELEEGFVRNLVPDF